MITDIYIDFFKKNSHKYILQGTCDIFAIILGKLALPHYYGKFIPAIKDEKFYSIKRIFVILILLWIGIQFFHIVSNYIETFINPQLIEYFRINIVKRIIESYKTDYSELKLGEMLTKINDSPYIIKNFIKESFRFVFKNLIIITSTFFYLFYYDYHIGLVYLVSMLLVGLISFKYYIDCKDYVIKSENNYININEEVEETLSNLLSIFSSNKISDEEKRLKKHSQISVETEIELDLCNVKYRLIYSLAFVIIFIVLNFYSYKIYLKKNITLDVLISIIIINYSILTTFMMIYYDISYYTDSKKRIDLLEEHLDKLPSLLLYTKVNSIKTNNLFKKPYVKIEFKNVSFSYNKKNILKNFNLTIQKKEKVVFMGDIGSGKSTIAKLIVGLKRYESGDILINGVSLRSLNINKLRNYITYIPQHPKLFNRTLYENITYGLEKVSENNIYKILKDVGLDDVVIIFKDIMHKKVGKSGSNLSGGQRQIVWLIRALLKDNNMIILDEPTSSLDKQSKEKIMILINELSKRRNIILITHDKDIIKNMSRLIILNKGQILEDNEIK